MMVNLSKEEIQRHMQQEDDQPINQVLLTDGRTLKKGLEINETDFLTYCQKYKFVCFARCSPKQKFDIAKILKQKMKLCVLAIGDGGNDVGMIQMSNVGVGIHGKEGA